MTQVERRDLTAEPGPALTREMKAALAALPSCPTCKTPKILKTCPLCRAVAAESQLLAIGPEYDWIHKVQTSKAALSELLSNPDAVKILQEAGK